MEEELVERKVEGKSWNHDKMIAVPCGPIIINFETTNCW